jgi:hypothetical protein
MKTLILACLLIASLHYTLLAQQSKYISNTSLPSKLADKNFLENLMKEDTSQAIYKVLYDPRKYRVQIIYTQINRDKKGKPKFKTFGFRNNDQEYFYPASMVKLPVMLLALEKIHRLNIKNLDMNTPLVCHRSSGGSFQTTVAEAIKKMLVVSDNYSFTILYEFVGQRYLHKRLQEMGYTNTSITQNFSYSSKPFRSFQFITEQGQTLYEELPEGKIDLAPIHVEKPVLGGKNFAYANHFPLDDIHKMVMTTMFPEAFPFQERPVLEDEDFEFLHKYMSIFPRECQELGYSEDVFPDAVFKFYLNAKNRSRKNPEVRCFNKVGISLGFLTDCSYFVDYENNTEFFVSCVIYVNQSGGVGDGNYEYQSVGYPFFTNLSRVLQEYEKKREKKYKPTPEKIDYQKLEAGR